MDNYSWVYDDSAVEWDHLSELYRIAPLGEKPPGELAKVSSNSMFKCFVYSDGVLVGAGRALADGLDCSYLADAAVHPKHQGIGLGKAIINQLVALSEGHKKVILYANPGTEGFYIKLGFQAGTVRDHSKVEDEGIFNPSFPCEGAGYARTQAIFVYGARVMARVREVTRGAVIDAGR